MEESDWWALGLLPPPTRADPPTGPAHVADLVHEAARREPDGLALVDDRTRYTFAELARAVDGAQQLFAACGIGPGDRVAASLGNDASLVVAFFATMRLNAVWVGINRVLPASDKAFILGHSGATLLLCETDTAAQCTAQDVFPDFLLVIDDPQRDGGWGAVLAGKGGPGASLREIDPFAPAAIMYTSGTTGVPKGVVHSQHNMAVVCAVTAAHDLMWPQATRGLALPLTITNVMILGPVMAYYNTRAFKMTGSPKVGPLVEWLGRQEVGHIAFVPTMIYDLLQGDYELPEGLRIGTGGAPLPPAARDAFKARYGYDLLTSYGLTEAPTVVAIPQHDTAPEGASGRALPHLRVTIRDSAGQELPIGQAGEVCVGPIEQGPWAGVYAPPLGYWRDGEKTAALLRGGVVHTGDHGRLDGDGWLTIVDRGSELILRGGSNVYPGEIERVIHGQTGVADCAVVPRPDARLGNRTVACVLKADSALDEHALEQDLRLVCAERLARYKVPDDWRFFNEFPRNAMGKVVKAKLRDLVAGSMP